MNGGGYRLARRGLHKPGSAQKTPPGRVAFFGAGDGESGAAPPVADAASRFQGSAPFGGRECGRQTAGATGKSPKRCLRQIKRGDFKEVSRWPPRTGGGHRLTRRGPHSRGAREGSLYSVRSASVSASWLGSLAALSAATRTRAPKRATVNQKAAPSRGDFLRGSILTNATVHRTVAPGFDAPLGRAKAGVRFEPLYFIRSKKNKTTHWVVLFFLERATRLELATSTLARSRSTR